jgi:hypothetical protein
MDVWYPDFNRKDITDMKEMFKSADLKGLLCSLKHKIFQKASETGTQTMFQIRVVYSLHHKIFLEASVTRTQEVL